MLLKYNDISRTAQLHDSHVECTVTSSSEYFIGAAPK